jgi:hypothetical protein
MRNYKKSGEIPVFHIDAVLNVKTAKVGGAYVTSEIKHCITQVGEDDMDKFIGYSEVRGKDGRLKKVFKKGGFKTYGFISAQVIKVTDKNGKDFPNQEELMEFYNKFIVEIETEDQTGEVVDLKTQNAKLLERIEALEKKTSTENTSLSSKLVADLKAICEEKEYPKEEWGDLLKPELITYIENKSE